MSKETNFKVSGLKELEQTLKKLDEDIIKSANRKAAKQAMTPVYERAKRGVPVDSGTLRDSIKLRAGSSSGKSKDRIAWSYVSVGGKDRKSGTAAGSYALAAHYGTSTADGDPFLLEAFEPHAVGILQHYKAALTLETDRGVKKMAKRANVKDK